MVPTKALLLLLTASAAAASQQVFQAEPSAATPKPYGRFLHITDLHPDTHYKHGSAVATGCHHKKPQKDRKEGHHRAGWWGTGVSDCDTPPRLVESSLKWVSDNWLPKEQMPKHHTAPANRSSLGQGLDFIIWTGDSARHDIDSKFPRTSSEIFELNRWTLAQIETAFPGVPIVPSIGNNDIFPHNIIFPGPNPVTKQFVQIWSDHIPEYEFHTFEQGGYFVKELVPNRLAAMSLNTLYFYDSNKAVDGCLKTKRHHEVDPGTAQLDWLEVQLDLFRKRGMQVHLIGHVPPTAGNYFERCYDRYTDIVLRFQDTVVGQHFGHMNTDAFLVQEDQRAVYGDYEVEEEWTEALDKGGLPADLHQDFSSLPEKARTNEDYYSVFYIAPSIIPTFYPSIRVWTYNTDDSERYQGVMLDQPPTNTTLLDDDDDDDETETKIEPLTRHHHRPLPPKRHKGRKDRKKKKKDKPLPRHASPDSPSRKNTYLSMLGYSQWVMDIDTQNARIEKLLKDGKEKEVNKMQVEYRLEYTTYEPATLWGEFTAQTQGIVPVPKHLLEVELRRLKADPPVFDSLKHKVKVPKAMRKFTDYSLPTMTVEHVMDLGRRLVVDKKLWKRFVKRIYSESGYME